MSSSTKVIHRFLRQPNINSNIHNRIGNRFDPFANTLSVLPDPSNNRELYLIGTTNSSTTLAYRTRKLIQDLKPQALYVQASSLWWDAAKRVQAVDQDTFRQISQAFPCDAYAHTNNLRGILWRLRFHLWIYKMAFFLNFPHDFTPFTPGLEIKLALEAAENANSNIHFGGVEFDPITIEALRTQTNMYAHVNLWKARLFSRVQNAWASEFKDFKTVLSTRGGESFAESIDRSRANFMVGVLSKIAPEQKKIMIDQRDESIFTDLYRCKGDKIVAVVNQWHMQGIETHWRRATGTEIPQEQVSPIADMDIDAFQERGVINDFLRELTSRNAKTEPATHQDYLTNYHKENFEYERTRHTHHRSHEDIPNPGETPKPHH